MNRATSKRQFAWNTASNLFVLAASSVAMLWFTPFLIDALGLGLYGLVPLASSLAVYMGVLTIGVQSAVGRYITLEVANDEYAAASRVMSTALGANLVIAAAIVPVLLGVALAAPRLFDIPAGHESDAKWFFALAMVSFVFVAVREVAGSAVFAANRIDLLNIARLTELALKVGVPVAAFAAVGPNVRLVGLGMLVGAFCSLIVAVAAWRISVPDVHASPRLFEMGRLRSMLTTGGWITVSHLGVLLHMATDVIVINLVLGTVIAGAYGSALQLSVFLRSLAGALSSVLAPVLFAQYAQRRIESLGSTAAHGVKLLGLAIGLPVALVVGFARPVLGLWLGPDLEVVAPVLVVMMLHLTFNYAILPLESVYMAFDRVKWPAIVSLATGVLNVALSLLLARVGEWAWGVALATAISLTLKNALFAPLYTAHVLGTRRRRFFASAAFGGVLSLSVGAAAFAVERSTAISTWGGLIMASVLVAAVYAGVAALLLSAEDRVLLRSLIPGLSDRLAR